MTIKNTGTGNMSGWTIEFDADFEITQVWNAQLVSHTGTHYVIKNIPGFWNAVIRPGQSLLAFGFNTRFDSGTSLGIRNVLLNGRPA
jgi:hypothetical protein